MAEIFSEWNGNVIGIACNKGDRVKRGDTVIELQIMGMKVPAVAPEAGVIENISVSLGDKISIGTPLFSMGKQLSDSDQVLCPKCGAINKQSARFCSACGEKMMTNTSATAMPQVQASNNDFGNRSMNNMASSYTQSTAYSTNNVTTVTKKKKHWLRNIVIVVVALFLIGLFFGNNNDEINEKNETNNKSESVSETKNNSTAKGSETSESIEQNDDENSQEQSTKEKDPNFMHDLNRQKTETVIYGIDYYGYGIVYYSQDEKMYYLRCPYIEESNGNTLYSTVRLPIDDESITEYSLSDGECVKISSHMVDHMTNDKFWLLFDECTRADTSFIYDIYNSASYETLPTYNSFTDFCRYGQKGQMCLLTNVRVYTTDEDSYYCYIDYNPDSYDEQVSLHLLDSGNGVTHTRILPEDILSVFCHLVRIESTGVPTFELDYIIDLNGNLTSSNQSTNSSSNIKPKTNTNTNIAATREDVLGLMWQDISTVVSTYGLSETPAGDGIISFQNDALYVEADEQTNCTKISNIMLNNDTYSFAGVYIGMDIGDAYDVMNSLGWEEIYLQYGTGVNFDSPDGSVEVWFMADEDAKVSRLIATGL